jgi:hypothetical protein
VFFIPTKFREKAMNSLRRFRANLAGPQLLFNQRVPANRNIGFGDVSQIVIALIAIAQPGLKA